MVLKLLHFRNGKTGAWNEGIINCNLAQLFVTDQKGLCQYLQFYKCLSMLVLKVSRFAIVSGSGSSSPHVKQHERRNSPSHFSPLRSAKGRHLSKICTLGCCL